MMFCSIQAICTVLLLSLYLHYTCGKAPVLLQQRVYPAWCLLQTLERIPKMSANWYTEVIKKNRLEMI